MMTPLWLAIAGLIALSTIFLLWPLVTHSRSKVAQETESARRRAQLEENIALFQEHLAELEESRNSGAVSDEQFAQVKLELERSLLEDERNLMVGIEQRSLKFGSRGLAVFALVVVLGSLGLYSILGASEDVYLQRLFQEKNQLDRADLMQQREPDPARAKYLGERLQKRLKSDPDNLQYWFLLARNAMELGEYGEAVDAYREVMTRDSESSLVIAELAQAMFLRDNNRVSPAIAELAESALALDSENTTALGLLGIYSYGNQDYRTAINYWERARRLMDPRSAGVRSLQNSIDRARQELIAAEGEDALAEVLTASSGPSITFEVSLAEVVQASADQWVYIYARAWQGSPMPVAITRMQVGDLPATIILDETMAMSTMSTLSTVNQVELVARISQAGEATARPGDWQGTFGPVDVAQQPDEIHLKIDHQVTAQ